MGGAASLVSTESEQQQQQGDFPKYGVRLSYYHKFIEKNGGRSAFEGRSTSEVCETIVKPATASLQCSYCDMLRRIKQSDAVGVATVFISHAWAFHFLDVCEALTCHFKDNMDVIVWFDLFSVNQHDVTSKSCNWWTTTFQSAIQGFGHTVMVFAPSWHNLAPLSRAWCLWELFCTAKTECKFEVALSPLGREQFFTDICGDTQICIQKMQSMIDAENSQCSKSEDRECIFEAMKSTAGFAKLNSVVFQKLRDWAMTMTAKEIGALSATSDMKRLLLLKRAQGQFYVHQRKYRQGGAIFETIFDQFREVFGQSHNETLSLFHSCASLLMIRENYRDAEEIFKEIVSNIQSHVVENDSVRDRLLLKAQHQLALIHNQRGRSDAAKELLVSTFNQMLQKFGERDVTTLAIMGDLASVYDIQGEKELAKEMYSRCLTLRQEVLGLNHKETISVLYSLGCLYFDNQENEQALIFMEDCVQRRCLTLGEAHEDTLQALEMLATIHDFLGHREQAEECLLKRLQGYVTVHGEETEITMYKKLDMGKWYEEKQLDEKAKPYFIAWWRYIVKTEGPGHSATNYAEDNLKDCLIRLGKLEEFDQLNVNM